MEEYENSRTEIVQLARLALVGRAQDVQTYVQRLARHYRASVPQLSEQLRSLLQESPTQQSPLRREAQAPLPVDLDSRLQLLRVDAHPTVETEPIWNSGVESALRQVITERRRVDDLSKQGLLPTRSLIFTGPPGVGKSLAARWVARELKRPLLTLDLSAVMSSYLGRTGSNIRHVLDYAKSVDCILLLDELDAIAKRRDDATDVGELKRLVTVLLQEIDDWPSSGLLIAATNHSDLLDPAIWRRFELRVAFPMPTDAVVGQAINAYCGPTILSSVWREILALTFRGLSFSDIEREINLMRRSAVVHDRTMEEVISEAVRGRIVQLERRDRDQIALRLIESGISQRQVHDLTGVSRDTLRKRVKVAEVTENLRRTDHA